MATLRTSRLAVLLAAALAAGTVTAAEDVERVNGSITANAGTRYGSLETVNGGITLEDGARTGSASTVNGSIRAGDDIASGDLTTVNGGVSTGVRARIDGDVTTVNGDILVRRGGEVRGGVTTVNGAIGLVATVVGGDIETVSGDVTVGIDSHVKGGLRVRKPGASWMPIRISTRRQRIVIGPGAVVEGPLRIEREVSLYVHDTARIGTVEGAEVVRYSTATAPQRGPGD